MKKHRTLLFAAPLLFLIIINQAQAQTNEPPKFEVGAQFSLLSIERVSGRTAEPGIGGRFTYNATDNVALEAELNFFPRDHNGANTNQEGGRITEGLFGLKAGKRFEKFGIFGKFRPGFVSFGRAFLGRDVRLINADPLNPSNSGRLTHFATDVGGVLEFYPSHRTIMRFDLGDTIIRYGKQDFIDLFGQPTPNPAFTRHNLQFSAGVSFRF
ncbi:MAG: hypothetical protein QOH63_1663 [Acidobacteriota bacterium]|jgi:hypothetical protein|nr:hypothetical protein [Acidobacteriota bacterium]